MLLAVLSYSQRDDFHLSFLLFLYTGHEAGVALGYCHGQLLRFFRALQTSHVLHNSIVHAKA